MPVIALVLSLLVTTCATDPPPLPRPEQADPMVAEVVADALARVRETPEDQSAWIELAELYHANAYLEEARECYRAALDLGPETARLHYLLAVLEHELGDVERALDHLGAAEGLDPERGSIHWRRGLWLLELGKTEEAEPAFRRARALDPAAGEPVVGLARIALMRRDPQGAIAILRGSEIRQTLAPYARRLLSRALAEAGRRDEARVLAPTGGPPVWSDPWLAQVLKKRTGYDALNARAHDLIESGRIDEASRILDTLRDRWPDDADLVILQGYAANQSGDQDEALRLWTTALGLDPNAALAHLNIGAVLAERAVRSGAPVERALASIERAAELAPRDPRPRITRGAVLAAVGRDDEAAQSFEAGLRLDPANVAALHQLGQIYLRTMQWDDAQRVLARYAAIEPRSPHAQLSLALACLEAGNLERASKALDAGATLLPPNHPQVRVLRTRLDDARAQAPDR